MKTNERKEMTFRLIFMFCRAWGSGLSWLKSGENLLLWNFADILIVSSRFLCLGSKPTIGSDSFVNITQRASCTRDTESSHKTDTGRRHTGISVPQCLTIWASNCRTLSSGLIYRSLWLLKKYNWMCAACGGHYFLWRNVIQNWFRRHLKEEQNIFNDYY